MISIRLKKYMGILLIVFMLGACSSGGGDSDGQDAVENGNGDTTTDTSQNGDNTSSTGAIISDHNASADFDAIPATYFATICASYHFYYGHTSHGSQVITGLDMLESENSLYQKPSFHEVSDDLGSDGDTSWATPTRTYLNAHPECNVVIWSWCGGVSYNDEDGINAYLDKMDQLEDDYPDVVFIYMTGHTDGSGAAQGDNLRANNARIRSYCATNGKVLFDFEDIESYDPNGTYYEDISDDCSWCSDWCDSHTCPSCSSCAHSHCFNCYQKGKAFWWMMARLSGWNG